MILSYMRIYEFPKAFLSFQSFNNMSKTALAALQIVSNWLAVDTQEMWTMAITKFNLIRSSTTDELEMMSICLQCCFGQSARIIQLPLRVWRIGCDPEHVSTLIRLTGYDNRISIDDVSVSISMDVTVNYSSLGQRNMLSNVAYLQKLSHLVRNFQDMRLCAQLLKTQQNINIFCNSFHTEHAMVSAILCGLSKLPFFVSPKTDSLRNLDFRVNFVRIAWMIEARGYSVHYRQGEQCCIVDALGVFPNCSTWTDRRSIMQNMPMFYKFSTADHC